MQIVEFPSDIVNASEYIKSIVMKVDRMSVSIGWNHTLIGHRVVFELTQTETPEIIKSRLFIFASKNVNILVICCDG